MQQKLEYSNEGRVGYVIYKDKQLELKFYFEFGGGNCVAIIFVPTTDEWTTKTLLPMEEREKILDFVARQAIKDQTSGGFYKLSENFIEIFDKKTAL